MRSYEVQTAGLTDIGSVRKTNEDNLLADGDLFVVADGMGGRGRGDVASRLAIDTIRELFEQDQTADGLLSAVRESNDVVFQLGEAEQDGQRSGTTIAAVAMVSDGDTELLISVNVGDSRVYLLRDGRLQRLSSDHSLVGDLVRAGALTESEAVNHPERHVLTQAVGTAPEIDPHVEVLRPAAGDRLLLCSDGLFNDVPSDDIRRWLDEADADAAAQGLVSAAIAAGGHDNITALVLDVKATMRS